MSIRKMVLTSLTAASLLACAGLAYAHEGHGRGHRDSAMGPCIAVMSKDQRTSLKETFHGQMKSMWTDYQSVEAAKKDLTSAILAGTQNVSAQETALATAQGQLQKDRDTMAAKVCSQLSSDQRTAAQTLYKNLQTLHENSRKQARRYFEAAKVASGAKSTPEVKE